jgi:hypothetical protein
MFMSPASGVFTLEDALEEREAVERFAMFAMSEGERRREEVQDLLFIGGVEGVPGVEGMAGDC